MEKKRKAPHPVIENNYRQISHFRLYIGFLIPLSLVIACSRSADNGSSPTGSDGPNSLNDVIQVIVLSDGNVVANGNKLSANQFDDLLDSAMDQEVWYFRETPEDDTAQVAGLEVLTKIEARGLPLVMYLDREFQVPANSID